MPPSPVPLPKTLHPSCCDAHVQRYLVGENPSLNTPDVLYYRTQSRLRAEDRPFGRHEDEELGRNELLQRVAAPEPPAGAERGFLPLWLIFARHVGKEGVADVCRAGKTSVKHSFEAEANQLSLPLKTYMLAKIDYCIKR